MLSTMNKCSHFEVVLNTLGFRLQSMSMSIQLSKSSYLPIQVVKEVIDPSATIEFRANTADDPHKRKPDISRAKELLNWEPKIPLREGLPRMVNDFRNRILNEDEGKGN